MTSVYPHDGFCVKVCTTGLCLVLIKEREKRMEKQEKVFSNQNFLKP